MNSDNGSLLNIIDVIVADLLLCHLDEAYQITSPVYKVYSPP